MEVITSFVESIIQILALFLEIMGTLVITYAGIVIFIKFCYLEFYQNSTDIKLRFARSLALGLEFQLASEILRTVSVRDLRDLTIVGALVTLRGLVTLLLHWEIKQEN